MATVEIGEVIATRKLYLVDDPDGQVIVKLGKPQPTPGQNDFYCPFQIAGIGTERIRAIYGIDAFQALQLTMDFIGAELARLNRLNGNRMRWECDETGAFGFPLPKLAEE